MIETDNIFTEIVTELQDELAGLRENIDAPTPFMQQKTTPAEFRKRHDSMSPGERKEMMEAMGRDTVLDLLRSK